MSDEGCPHGLGDPAWCSVCKHGPSKPEPVTVEALFCARYGGYCSDCGQPLTVGERIAKLSNGSYVHEECAL